MKKFLRSISFLLVLLAFVAPLSAYEIVQGEKMGYGKQKVIKPEEVGQVVFHVYQATRQMGQSTFDGYILFRNAAGENCMVNSANKLYVWVGEDKEPNRSVAASYDYYKAIIVGPSSFKLMRLRSGETILGIPLGQFSIRAKKEGGYEKKSQALPLVKMYWIVDREGVIRKQVRPYAPY